MVSDGARSGLVRTARDAVLEGTCVWLIGLPGAGRSYTLDRVGDALRSRDWDVVVLREHGLADGARPLQSLVLSGLAPGATSLNSAVEALEQRFADERSVLLVDGAHAVDEVSAAVIGAVLGRRQVPIVAGAPPPWPDAARSEELLDGRQATTLWLPALPFEEIYELAQSLLRGEVEAGVAGRVYSLSGGMPGFARSIVTEARRAGHLVLEGGRWTARRDLWTPALKTSVERLLRDLGDEGVVPLRVLAALGPTDVETAQEVLSWDTLVRLDDHGLLRFVEEEGRTVVVLYPPLLGEHLRQTGHGARGMRAVEIVSAALGRPPAEGQQPTTLAPPRRWSSSPESASVLGRVLRDHATTRVLACRDAWERTPSVRAVVDYLDALVVRGAPHDQVEAVLAAAHSETLVSSSPSAGLLVAWEATYRASAAGDLEAAQILLASARSARPQDAELFVAVSDHIRLTLGGPPLPGGAVPLAPAPGLEEESMAAYVGDVARLVAGERLLAEGRAVEAMDLMATVHVSSPVPDYAALMPLATLCAGQIDTATNSALRLLEEAQGALDELRIEFSGYVAALGLYLQGRLTTLRDHLSAVFAINAASPLRPQSHAGLLTVGAVLALADGNLLSARSMTRQAQATGVLAAYAPACRPAVAAAAVDVADGMSVDELAWAWDGIVRLADDGHVLAALCDGAWLLGDHPDRDRARDLAARIQGVQGPLLHGLHGYVSALGEGSVEELLAAADELLGCRAVLPAARSWQSAVRLLLETGHYRQASVELARLREVVLAEGEELSRALRNLEPGAQLTEREREVARLAAAGESNREIARRLSITERTVENHVYRIFRKLAIGSREELRTALQHVG
ncbi:hypothetical protein FE251_11795 [Georgenia wutianyii]|uniref:HTH luxR-type domain-containing protein n=1 Tax=Georgenia wutianyii TaxID=2585135 RepID=A0ABX5VN93_9MICO|nr:LuxR C-terminal-related transcriptional regulator [Georgenia wutianyii]QDB79984.1 hypothetical protein FE251_11795 [Georgenia wutianyii]